MKNIAIGVVAHVDSGKTTLSESMLYKKGHIRKLGRVDHKDTFLDTFELEKERGITIFSKQAVINAGDTTIYLLDTPGHVDFSAEMERTCKVLDYAVLIMDGSSEIKSHTYTLWKILSKYNIPTFIFINKMDMSLRSRDSIIAELHSKLSSGIVEYRILDEFYEEVASCSEGMLDKYLNGKGIEDIDIANAVAAREVFLCCFGSALKLEGIDELLEMLDKFTLSYENRNKIVSSIEYNIPNSVASNATNSVASNDTNSVASNDTNSVENNIANCIHHVSARVYKISRDESGNRLTHMKITGGILRVKDTLSGDNLSGDEQWEEKVNQIRIYSGNKYEMVKEATAGMVVAVTGLSKTFAGAGIGGEKSYIDNMLEPVLSYTVEAENMDSMKLYNVISVLGDEDASLQISWNETFKSIEIKLMGPIQIEVLTELIRERFGINVTFGKGKIIYKETVTDTVIGIGHYEPLRHYAEVHLRISPGTPGSGVVAISDVSVDDLERNWQRLIITHIKEKKHRGVLTGSELTDVEIAIVAGKAHKKHTEGGDFRQATYRGIRQGLMKAESVLLEPIYEFTLQIPREFVGRAMTDIEQMYGKCEPPELQVDTAIINGYCPVATMMDYVSEVMAYSKGRGVLVTRVKGYDKCHNSEEIISSKSYNPLADIEDTPDSVFCAGGAGINISYNKVEEYMHIPMDYLKKEVEMSEDIVNNDNINKTEDGQGDDKKQGIDKKQVVDSIALDKELMGIFEKTYGQIKQKDSRNQSSRTDAIDLFATVKKSDNHNADKYNKDKYNKDKYNPDKQKKDKPEYLLVDGYNVLFADEDLSELAKNNLDGARYKLMDMLSNYKGVKKHKLMVIFDAYRVKGGNGSVSEYHNITVVYTKEAETADSYIERFAHDNASKYKVTVATSDGLEQIIIRGEGCRLMSSRELLEDMKNAVASEVQDFNERKESGKVYIKVP